MADMESAFPNQLGDLSHSVNLTARVRRAQVEGDIGPPLVAGGDDGW